MDENTLNAEQADAPSTSSNSDLDWWEKVNNRLVIGPGYRTVCPVIISGPYTPEYATDGASGFDLESWNEEHSGHEVGPGETLKIPTGLRMALPRGYEMQIRPRSGLSSRGIMVQFGTVDSDYRGELMVIVHNATDKPFLIEHGDRIAQGVIAPVTRAVFAKGEVTEDTQRGAGGFGSTGV